MLFDLSRFLCSLLEWNWYLDVQNLISRVWRNIVIYLGRKSMYAHRHVPLEFNLNDTGLQENLTYSDTKFEYGVVLVSELRCTCSTT